MDIGKIKKDAADLLAKRTVIEAAYLFGSTVNGFDRISSDVDIAIRLVPEATPEAAFDLRPQLADELEGGLGRPVDIVILNNASLKRIRQVLTNGRLLYTRDENAERLYVIQKRKEYFDFRFYLEKSRRELRSYFGAAPKTATSQDQCAKP